MKHFCIRLERANRDGANGLADVRTAEQEVEYILPVLSWRILRYGDRDMSEQEKKGCCSKSFAGERGREQLTRQSSISTTLGFVRVAFNFRYQQLTSSMI